MTDNYTDGLTVRRQVMGDEFVEQALDNATEFTKPLQDFITRNAWGSVWCRGGIDLKTRSLITIATLVALYRLNELPFHLKLGLDNGLTREEIVETITHLAFYAGWPAASTAVGIARRVFEDAGQ